MLKELENQMLLWAKPIIGYLMEAVIFEVKWIQNKYGSDTKWRKQCEQKNEVRNECGICLELKVYMNK